MTKFFINLHEAIFSLSDALDLVGVVQIHHGKRVAFMAAECGKKLGWKEQQLDNLFQAAMLHDCGVSNTAVHARLAQFEWEKETDHCVIGSALLQATPPLAHLSEYIRYHHTHWSELQQANLADEIAIGSNCIHMVDRVDILTLKELVNNPNILAGRHEVRSRIAEKKDSWFHPELVEVFLEISNSEAFWLSLEREHVDGYVSTWVAHETTREVDFSELKSIVQIFSHIVDAKSSFTKQHSDGVACLSRFIGECFNLSERSCDMLELAGLLHDLGKLRVPDEILEKKGTLTETEYLLMQRHSFDTYNILKNIKGFEEVSTWAAQHHERLDGSGYPFHSNLQQTSLEARIIAVADVFQALAQKRPYRDSLEPDNIMAILNEQQERGLLDGGVVLMVENHLGNCWEAAVDHELFQEHTLSNCGF